MRFKIIFPITFLLLRYGLMAQDCNTFFPFEQGVTLEYSFYDAKGKLSTVSNQKIIFLDDADAAGLTAQVEAVLTDKNAKELSKGNYKVTCKDNTLLLDMTAMMPQITQAFSGMEMQMTGDQLQLPSKLSAGQTLPNAHLEIRAGSGGMNLMKMTIDVTERTVEAKESVTTALGTYEAFKISYTTNTKMLVGKNFKTITWYAPKIGMIKQENYDKKGNLEGSMILTKFSKQ